jgi:hypothetical protein
LLQATFRYGDVLLRRRCVYRRFVWRRFVEETFCRGDVLYVRPFSRALLLAGFQFVYTNQLTLDQ